MNKKITIIGSGAMGTASAKVILDANNKEIKNVLIYGIDEKELSDLSKGKNKKYFPSSTNLPNFKTSNNLKEAIKGASYIIFAIPSKQMKIMIDDILKILDHDVLFINVAKGFYPGKKEFLHFGIENDAKKNKFVRGVVSLIGPSHAEEIVQQIPTAVAAVCRKKELCKEVQKIFSNFYFRVYIQRDVSGAMTGAAYKNVLAIASGISSQLGNGINTTAALLTRGLSEMAVFVKSQGGKKRTMMGLTGIGDLIVTATSDLSRNFTFGKEFVRNNGKIIDFSKTVEGLEALKFIYEIGHEKKLDLPIAYFLYDVIYGEKKLSDFKKDLWDRELKEE